MVSFKGCAAYMGGPLFSATVAVYPFFGALSDRGTAVAPRSSTPLKIAADLFSRLLFCCFLILCVPSVFRVRACFFRTKGGRTAWDDVKYGLIGIDLSKEMRVTCWDNPDASRVDSEGNRGPGPEPSGSLPQLVWVTYAPLSWPFPLCGSHSG